MGGAYELQNDNRRGMLLYVCYFCKPKQQKQKKTNTEKNEKKIFIFSTLIFTSHRNEPNEKNIYHQHRDTHTQKPNIFWVTKYPPLKKKKKNTGKQPTEKINIKKTFLVKSISLLSKQTKQKCGGSSGGTLNE